MTTSKIKILIFSLLCFSFQLYSMQEKQKSDIKAKYRDYRFERGFNEILLKNKKNLTSNFPKIAGYIKYYCTLPYRINKSYSKVENENYPKVCLIDWVQSDKKNRGIGTWLMLEAIKDMETKNCQKCALCSYTNTAGFYTKLGFMPDTSLENYCQSHYGSNNLIPMSRTLKNSKK